MSWGDVPKTDNCPLPFILQVLILEVEMSWVHEDMTSCSFRDCVSRPPLQLSVAMWLNSHHWDVKGIHCAPYVVLLHKHNVCLLLLLPLPTSGTENMKQVSWLLPCRWGGHQRNGWTKRQRKLDPQANLRREQGDRPFPYPLSRQLTSISFEPEQFWVSLW